MYELMEDFVHPNALGMEIYGNQKDRFLTIVQTRKENTPCSKNY